MNDIYFITDRTREDIDKVTSGNSSDFYKHVERACLTRNTFWRWASILDALGYTSFNPPSSNYVTITSTAPGEIIGAPEGSLIYGNNFAYDFWYGINLLIDMYPEEFNSDSAPDLLLFPENMDNLTFENVNVLERVMQYAYENGLTFGVG